MVYSPFSFLPPSKCNASLILLLDRTPSKSISCKDVYASCQLPRRVMVTIATADLPLLGYSFPNETDEVGGAGGVVKPVVTMHHTYRN